MNQPVQQPQYSTYDDHEALGPPLISFLGAALSVLWRYKLYFVFGIVLAVGTARLYQLLRSPTYESYAQVLVERIRPRSLPIPGVAPQLSFFDDSVASHQSLIGSSSIIGEAVERQHLDELPHLKAAQRGGGTAEGAIGGGISVTRNAESLGDRYSAIFGVSYRSKSEREGAEVIDAVIETYREHLSETQHKESEGLEVMFQEWQSQLNNSLAEKKATYQKMRDEVPAELWKAPTGINFAESRLSGLTDETLANRIRLNIVRHRLRTLENARQEKASQQALLELISRWVTDDRPTGMREELRDLMLEETTLLKKFGPKHPDVIAVKEQIRVMRKLYLGEEQDQAAEELGDTVTIYIESLRQELKVAESLDESFAELVRGEHVSAKQTDAASEDREVLRLEILDLQALQKEVSQRMQQLSVSKSSEVFSVQILSAPGKGELVMTSNPRVYYPLAVLAGIGFGCGLVMLADMSNKRYRSPQDISMAFGVPVVGHIPYFRPSRREFRIARKNKACDPMVITQSSPMAEEAEAFRGVRTAVLFNGFKRDSKVVQVTSPDPGDGKSVLASNLATSLAHSGKRTLLIDADLRKPQMHSLFRLDNKAGLNTLLNGNAEYTDLICSAGIRNLEVLPAGPIPIDPSDLLSSRAFHQLLETLRLSYDFIVIDSPPVSAATDAIIIAHRVDEVLLVIRNTNDGRTSADRAIQTLLSQQVPVSGVVVRANRGRSSDQFGYDNESYVNSYGGDYYGTDIVFPNHMLEDREGANRSVVVDGRVNS